MDSTLVPVKNTVFVHSENKMPSEVVLARSLPSSLESSVSDSTSIRTTSTEEKAKDLPVKVQSKYLRHLRHTFLNVYRRIFSVILLVNIIALVCVLARNYEVPSDRLTDIATAASANTLVIILIRQDYVVNGIFRVCWSATFLPLRIRRILAKCYEFGGVVCCHSRRSFISPVYSPCLYAVALMDPWWVQDFVTIILIGRTCFPHWETRSDRQSNSISTLFYWFHAVSVGSIVGFTCFLKQNKHIVTQH